MGDVDVGADDAVMLLEPEPHMPDNPDVSSIPEDVDSPDVVEICDDVATRGIAMVPVVAIVVGVVVSVAIPSPPPS